MNDCSRSGLIFGFFRKVAAAAASICRKVGEVLFGGNKTAETALGTGLMSRMIAPGLAISLAAAVFTQLFSLDIGHTLSEGILLFFLSLHMTQHHASPAN